MENARRPLSDLHVLLRNVMIFTINFCDELIRASNTVQKENE